ncbi:MAG: enoyl-CoA hydratase/isomerase family protein [Dehalococcoidia bacterium]|nr:enoyl-CoA hydratase/isomerase family protein [Dehalococcoidia bacterium]MDW8119915.1 enoyl-CoA hydratase/isomerase family protein [Chloroflexota bacterium]
MSAFQTIRFTKEEGVATLTLWRPQVINAYNIQMRDEVWEVLHALRDDPEVRVVVVCGAGERGFCAGADLTEFGTAPSQVIARWVRFIRPVWETWASIPKPFVCAIHGWCLGSGVEMALLCDLRVAGEDAVFGMPEVALGMIPAAGGTQTLPRHIGPSRTLEMLLTNRRLSAREAWAWGVVQRVVPKGQHLAEGYALARALARLPVEAVALLKESLGRGADLPMEEALRYEQRLALLALGRAH